MNKKTEDLIVLLGRCQSALNAHADADWAAEQAGVPDLFGRRDAAIGDAAGHVYDAWLATAIHLCRLHWPRTVYAHAHPHNPLVRN